MAALSVQRVFSASNRMMPLVRARGSQALAQGAIAGDAAGSSDTANAEPLSRADRLGHEHVHDGRLHAGAQVAQLAGSH